MNGDKARPRDYHDLLVWKKGMMLAKQIYGITQVFPDTERFGLVTQMRRGAVSVPSNIAEGQAHNTTASSFSFSLTPWAAYRNWTLNSF